jgi:hypothetical protein
MLNWLNPRPDPSSRYLEMRASGRSLISKIWKSAVSKEYAPIKAAKKLTLPRSGRTLLFDGETEMNAFADFMIHEFRVGGRSLIQRCDASQLGLTPLEAEVLVGLQHARTSLFEVGDARSRAHQTLLQDLLKPDREAIWLTDHGLSLSLGANGMPMLIFLRLTTVQDINMTSGVSFVFTPDRKEQLLRGYEQRMKTVEPADRSERRFVFFFQRHLECGDEQRYQDVTQPPDPAQD